MPGPVVHPTILTATLAAFVAAVNPPSLPRETVPSLGPADEPLPVIPTSSASASVSPFDTVLLAAPGFPLDEAAAAFRLRAPDLTVLTQWQNEGPAASETRVFVGLRLDPTGRSVRLEVVRADGSGYVRRVPTRDASLRRAVNAAVSLLISIERDGTKADVDVRAPPMTSASHEVDALLAEVDAQLQQQAVPPPPVVPLAAALRDETSSSSPAEIVPAEASEASEAPLPDDTGGTTRRISASSPTLSATSATAPRYSVWRWGASLRAGIQAHAAQPVYARPFEGASLGLAVALRSLLGSALQMSARWLRHDRFDYRMQRIRIGAAGGYEWGRGRLRMPTMAEVGVEPWWLVGPGGEQISAADLSMPAGASLLVDVGVRIEPAYEFTLRGAAIGSVRVGASLFVRHGFGFDGGLRTVGIKGDVAGRPGEELYRLGGLVVGGGLATTFWFGRAGGG